MLGAQVRAAQASTISAPTSVADIKKLLDRPIAFQRSFVGIGGSVNAALFLSQAFYWSNRTNDVDGWFYKTQSEWEEETGLTRREQDGARAKLKQVGVLEERLEGIPARLFYRVNLEAICEAMHQTAKQDAPVPPPDAPNRQTNAPNRQTVGTKPPNSEHQTAKHLTETTQGTTQEITSETTPPDSVDNRILCESLGVFAVRQQEEIFRLYKVAACVLKLSPAQAREKIIARWDEYQRKASKFDWKWGSAYKFLISGLWDKPEMWPQAKQGNKADPMAGMTFINGGN